MLPKPLSSCLLAESFTEPGIYIVNGWNKPCTIKKWDQFNDSLPTQSCNAPILDVSFFIKRMGAAQKSYKKVPSPEIVSDSEHSHSKSQVSNFSQSVDPTENSIFNGYKKYIEEKALIIRNRKAFNKWFIGWLETVVPISGLQKSTIENLKQVAANEMSKMQY